MEPNKNLHAALLKTVKECGLSDVYTVVGSGGEEMVGGEGVDCVVCVQVCGFFLFFLY